MNDLLELALDAHGGLARWREVSAISARASASGFFFSSKNYEGRLSNVGLEVRTHEQRTTLSPFLLNVFLESDPRRAICTPLRTVIESPENQTSDTRENPIAAFEGHNASTPWDDLHLAYFLGYASWNYFNEPFILTLPGFKVEEIEPWDENEQTWRRLKVTFPEYIAAHCTDQVFYFNASGLLVRMDYAPRVRGNVPSTHYLLDHKIVDGLVLPERRRIYRRDPSGHPILDKVMIAVDYTDYRLS